MNYLQKKVSAGKLTTIGSKARHFSAWKVRRSVRLGARSRDPRLAGIRVGGLVRSGIQTWGFRPPCELRIGTGSWRAKNQASRRCARHAELESTHQRAESQVHVRLVRGGRLQSVCACRRTVGRHQSFAQLQSRCSSTAAWAWARRTSCTPSAARSWIKLGDDARHLHLERALHERDDRLHPHRAHDAVPPALSLRRRAARRRHPDRWATKSARRKSSSTPSTNCTITRSRS